MDILLLVGGLVLLVFGAELLVRGASRLAAALGISPLVIGLTIVAFGTSAPEMAVSAASSLAGRADIALGNVIGSNIFNVLAILGLSALVTPLFVQQQLIRLDVPLMIAVSALVYLFALDGRIGQTEGVFLLFGIIAYTVFLILKSRKENADIAAEYEREFGNRQPSDRLKNAFLIAAGLGLLVLGSRWLVQGAVAIAGRLGVSELVIGLTIVAAGTSLPELATSVIASIRGERDIAVGNVIGSNLFNLLAVLGIAGVLAPDGVAVRRTSLQIDLPVMLATAIACLPVFLTGRRISRTEGILFLIGYVAYTVLIVLCSENA